MKIIKNVLPKQDLETLKNVFLSDNFNWFFNNATSPKNKYTNKETFEVPQFTHIFINNEKINSQYYLEKLSSIFDKIYKDFDINKIIRMKLNLQLAHKPIKNKKYNTPHTDNDAMPVKILLFYLNDCDAYTYFFKDKKIIKKVKVTENTLIQFDGKIVHAGSNPIKTPYKLCLNINYV